jgi:hypothetical protein
VLKPIKNNIMKTVLNVYSCNNEIVKSLLIDLKGHTVSNDYLNNVCQNLANIFGAFRIDIIFEGGDHYIWKFKQEEKLRKDVASAILSKLTKVQWRRGMDYKDYAYAISDEINYLYYTHPLCVGHLLRHLSLSNGDAPRTLSKELEILRKFVNNK